MRSEKNGCTAVSKSVQVCAWRLERFRWKPPIGEEEESQTGGGDFIVDQQRDLAVRTR